MESVSALGSPVVVFPHSSLETGLMLQCVTTSNVDIDMKPDFGLQPSASGEDLTPPDTLSAPTPELPHAREDDAEMADVTPPQSQSVGMSQSAEHPFEYVSYTHLPSKARHRSRSRSVRYTPYDNEAAQTQAVPASAPAATTQPSKQSKMTGRPQMSYAELITDAICESETGWLSLQEIYEAIKTKYSFFRNADPAWQNSIRHNLSVNATFTKVPRPPDRPGKGSLWTTTKYPHGYDIHGDSGHDDGDDRHRKNRRPRKPSAGDSRARQQRPAEDVKARNIVASTAFSHYTIPEPSSPSRSGEDSACSTAAGGSRMDSPGSPKDVTKNNYDLVAESVQHVPEVEKFHAGRKNMQLLAERAFHAPNLSHILQIPPSQFPTLPSDKAFAGSTATICIEEDDAGDHDPDLAGYLKQAGAPSKEGLHVPGHGKPGSRQSPWSMLTIPTMGHDGKPMDFGKDLFGRSRNGSPLPFLYSLSRATSPCSFLLGSWYGGPGTNATTTNFAVPEDAPAKLPSRLSSTSIATEGGDAMEAH